MKALKTPEPWARPRDHDSVDLGPGCGSQVLKPPRQFFCVVELRT